MNKFRYMSQVYNITNSKVGRGENSRKYLGRVIWHKNSIRLKSSLTGDGRRSTLMHEIIHIILGEGFGGEEAERIINVLANGFIHALRENPKLADYMMEEENDHKSRR